MTTNISRLVVDFIRRSLQPVAAGLIAFLWWQTEGGSPGVRWVLVASMWLVFMIGPVWVFAQLTPLPVRLLPMSRREIWRARWWLAFVVPVAISAAGKLIAILVVVLRGTPANWPGFALSTAYDAAYCGFFLGLVPLTRRWWWWLTLLLYAGGMFWPIVVASWIPTTWAALVQSPIGVAMAVALMMGINSYWFSPLPTPHASPRDAAAPAPLTRISRVQVDDPFTGLRKLVWSHWLLTSRNLVLMLAGYVVVIGGFAMLDERAPADLVTLLRQISLLPFDRDAAFPQGLTGVFLLGFLGVAIGYSSNLQSDFVQVMARSLRALPIGTRRLLALHLTLPILSWVTWWALLVILQIVVTGRLPVTLHGKAFALLTAIDLVARSVQLRWRRDLVAWHFVLLLITIVGMGMIAKTTGVPAMSGYQRPAMIVGTMYILAAGMNYLALTRSRAPYTAATRDCRRWGLTRVAANRLSRVTMAQPSRDQAEPGAEQQQRRRFRDHRLLPERHVVDDLAERPGQRDLADHPSIVDQADEDRRSGDDRDVEGPEQDVPGAEGRDQDVAGRIRAEIEPDRVRGGHRDLEGVGERVRPDVLARESGRNAGAQEHHVGIRV